MRRYYWLYATLILLFSFQTSLAIEVNGSVFGKWTIYDSPVFVIGDIIIEADKTLIVDPGVNIFFDDGVVFEVNGLLEMEGTPGNRIFMGSDVSDEYWNGIIINDATFQDGFMRYVDIMGAVAGIRVISSRFMIISCEVDITWIEGNNNDAAFASHDGSYLEISRSKGTVVSELAEANVVNASYSTIIMDSDCEFELAINDAGGTQYGKGVSLDHVSGRMEYCHVDVTSSCSEGRPNPVIGIDINGIENFFIHHNSVHVVSSSEEYSYAVNVHSVENLILNHFSIHLEPTAEQSNIVGIGVRSESNVFIKNTIIANFNEEYYDYCYSCFNWAVTSTVTVMYSCLYNTFNPTNERIHYFGDTLVLLNPEWTNDKYYLSATSPCIDMGEPGLLDPDGTRLDIGMHFYHQYVNLPEKTIEVSHPGNFRLVSIYPNPFNSTAAVKIHVPFEGNLNVQVIDVLGRKVSELASGMFEAGTHSLSWNGLSFSGEAASGIYFIRASFDKVSVARKVVLLR